MSTEKPLVTRQESAASIPSGTPIVEAIRPEDASKPPDGGYGWVVCLSCMMINSFTWGIAATFGVYLSYYLDNNVFPGASSTDYAYIGGSNFAGAMLVSPVLGPVIKTLGTNATIMIGCFIYSGGYIAASFARTFWELVLAQGVCVGLGIGVIWQPSIPILPQWFSKKRSLAQGLASCGSGFGGMIFSFATTPMIKNVSLAWSLRITGMTSFVVLMVAAIFIRDRNEYIVPRSRPFDIDLMKRYQVLLLLGWSVTNILGYIVMIYSLSSFAVAIGLTQSQGGTIIALQNLGTALGRPFIGVLSDRFGRITVAAAITAFNALLVFAVWLPANNFGVLAFLALVTGATVGVFWSTIAPLGAEVVGLVDLPSMLNLAWIFVALPTFFSETVALVLRRPGSNMPYLYPQIYSGVAYIVAVLFLIELRRSKWGLWARERHH